MAILYGTQSNGETLPVLVDQFGNLIAKGIEGQPGPPGPPGVGELPPDPFEGAILGWKDGELAWLGGSVPLPEGTYGPFIYVSESATLEIPQDASSLVNGQQLYMSDALGNSSFYEYSTDTIKTVQTSEVTRNQASQISSFEINEPLLAIGAPGDTILTFLTDNNFDKFEVGDVVQDPGSPELISTTDNDVAAWVNGWNNDINYSTTSAPCTLTWNIQGPGELIFKGLRKSGDNPTMTLKINGTQVDSIVWGTALNQVSGTLSAGNNLVEITGSRTFKLYSNSSTIDGNTFKINQQVSITGIDAAGLTITVSGGSWLGTDGSGEAGGDTKLTTQYSGEGSVLFATDGSIVLRSNNGQWVNDFYVTTPQQRIAARKAATSAMRKKTK